MCKHISFRYTSSKTEYSVNLLDEAVEILKKKRNVLKKSNKVIVSNFDETDSTSLKAIELERAIVFSLEILSQTKQELEGYLE